MDIFANMTLPDSSTLLGDLGVTSASAPAQLQQGAVQMAGRDVPIVRFTGGSATPAGLFGNIPVTFDGTVPNPVAAPSAENVNVVEDAFGNQVAEFTPEQAAGLLQDIQSIDFSGVTSIFDAPGAPRPTLIDGEVVFVETPVAAEPESPVVPVPSVEQVAAQASDVPYGGQFSPAVPTTTMMTPESFVAPVAAPTPITPVVPTPITPVVPTAAAAATPAAPAAPFIPAFDFNFDEFDLQLLGNMSLF